MNRYKKQVKMEYQRAFDLISNMAFRHKLPERVHVMFTGRESETIAKTFGTDVDVKYMSGVANITCHGLSHLAPGSTPSDIVDILLKDGTPLICDEAVFNQLNRDSTSWLDEGHYRLVGRKGGVLEIYIPYKSEPVAKDLLPPSFVSGQIFKE